MATILLIKELAREMPHCAAATRLLLPANAKDAVTVDDFYGNCLKAAYEAIQLALKCHYRGSSAQKGYSEGIHRASDIGTLFLSPALPFPLFPVPRLLF
jgi:hypothetical protein